MEDARSCRAKFQRNLYTPRIIEEYHRAIVKKRMSAFLQSNQIDLLVLSKLTTVHLFGYEAIARLGRPCILDLHDDSIEEERAQRELTARLARARHVWRGRPRRHFWSGIACCRRGSGWPAACVMKIRERNQRSFPR
jgi:hypothetical protein